MTAYVVLISIFFIDIVVGEKLLQPKKKCVPTATIHGVCHMCICQTDGVFHCYKELCKPANPYPKLHDCEPYSLYREETTFCSCSASGHWVSEICRKKFGRLPLQKDPMKKNIRTNIPCEPASLYIIDCNVCNCNQGGVINFNSCTTRSCVTRHKGDYCNTGEVFRSAHEFCICSHLNYYIDRLCMKVTNEVIQSVNSDELSHIINFEKAYINVDENSCEGDSSYSIDCKTCNCNGNAYVCEDICYNDKAVMRTADTAKSTMLELADENEPCTPGMKYKYKCNTCLCNKKGQPLCTSMICLQDIVVDAVALRQIFGITFVFSGNTTEGTTCSTKGITFLNTSLGRSEEDLPQIKRGEKCTPGKVYKKDCNRCHCTETRTLFCSKMACVDTNFVKFTEELRQGMKAAMPPSLNKNQLPALARSKKLILPSLPKGKCIPGRVYKIRCKRCFCNYLRKIVCSSLESGACENMPDGRPVPILKPQDVRPEFSRDELKNLRALGSASQKCEPGKSYKVSCNNCICTEKFNLICTKKLCLSFEDINRVEADEKSGKKCSDSSEIVEAPCIKCECVKGKTSCSRITNCTETRTRLSKSSNATVKMQIDPIKDTCIPGGIYTDNCNRCYCQPDASLRCTQKTCLNYAQSKVLDEQFKRLEKEGL